MTLRHYQLQPVMLLSSCSAPGHRLDITKRVHIQYSASWTGDAAWPSIWDRVMKTNSSHVKASCGNVGYRCGPPSLSPLRTLAGPDKTLLRVKALILAAGELIGSHSWTELKPRSDKGSANPPIQGAEGDLHFVAWARSETLQRRR